MKKYSLLSLMFMLLTLASCSSKITKTVDHSEFTNVEYWNVVLERAAKIVAPMELKDEANAKYVQDLIAAQYYRLNAIYDVNEAAIKEIKASTTLSEEEQNAKVEAIKSSQKVKVDALHDTYVAALSEVLSEEQVSEVKDGMTYHVAPKTYAAFLDMIPALTEEQKAFIKDALYEAREHAMSAGSSKEKHAWFGKYKGRINNYLAKEGYDLNTLSNEWHERLKAQGIQL